MTARLGWRLLLVLGAAATLLVAVLPDPARPAVVGAVVAEAAVVAAAVSAWRSVGTAALVLVTVSVLLASALDDSELRPVQVVVAGVLLLVVLTALDRVEQTGPREGRSGVRVLAAPAGRRLAAPALAVAAAALVSVTAAQQVVPSVGLVVVGLAAAVAALVVTMRAHRD